MVDVSTIKAIIAKRIETSDEWPDGLYACWDELANALSEDVEFTKRYLENDCTADELSWISEVFEELIDKTQSRELIEAIELAIKRFPKENERYHLESSLESAVEGHLL